MVWSLWAEKAGWWFGFFSSLVFFSSFLKEEKSEERDREVNGNMAARGEDYVNIS